MLSFRNKAILMLTALFALFVFTGDLVADAICEATGACVSESQESDNSGGDQNCPACACAVQSAAVVRTETATLVHACAMEVELVFPVEFGAAPDGVRAAIDHPPQLA